MKRTHTARITPCIVEHRDRLIDEHTYDGLGLVDGRRPECRVNITYTRRYLFLRALLWSNNFENEINNLTLESSTNDEIQNVFELLPNDYGNRSSCGTNNGGSAELVIRTMLQRYTSP